MRRVRSRAGLRGCSTGRAWCAFPSFFPPSIRLSSALLTLRRRAELHPPVDRLCAPDSARVQAPARDRWRFGRRSKRGRDGDSQVSGERETRCVCSPSSLSRRLITSRTALTRFVSFVYRRLFLRRTRQIRQVPRRIQLSHVPFVQLASPQWQHLSQRVLLFVERDGQRPSLAQPRLEALPDGRHAGDGEGSPLDFQGDVQPVEADVGVRAPLFSLASFCREEELTIFRLRRTGSTTPGMPSRATPDCRRSASSPRPCPARRSRRGRL